MDLTPLKVSNKSKSDRSKAVVAARKAKNPTQGKGRPFKPRMTDIERYGGRYAPTLKVSKKRQLKDLKSRRRMSALEKLPTELLQHIFLYCLNPDLPRSSPVIGGSLSDKSMYLKVVLAAFAVSWDSGQEGHNTLESKSRWNAELQSSILRCRWANLDILLEAKESWRKTSARSHIIRPMPFRVAENMFRTYDEMAPTSLSLVHQDVEEDFADFCTTCSEEDGPSIWDTCNWDSAKELAYGIEIPISLLSGPWTDEMIKHLYWLVKSGAGIDWVQSTLGEVAVTGLRSAIMDGDIRAIHLLHWAGMQDRLEMDTVVWALQNAGVNKKAVITHLLRLRYVVMSDPDARKLGRALSYMRDEAAQDDDKEKMAFFEFIRQSTIIRGASNVHV